MIKQLSLTDWKSFEEATIFIDPLTVLIGSNASGKSNALDALLFLNRVSQGIAIFPAISGDVNLSPLRGGSEWICRKPAKRFTLNVIVAGETSKQDYRYTLTVQVNASKAEVFSEELSLLNYRSRVDPKPQSLFYTKQDESDTSELPTYFSTGTQGRGRRVELSRSNTILAQTETLTIREEVKKGAEIVLASLRKIFVFDPIPSHMRDYSALSDQLRADGSNIAGVLAGMEGERKNQVEHTITGYLRELPERDIKRIWTETVGKFGADAMLYCEEGWENQPTHEIDARGMSDGTLRYLAIVTALLTREPESLLVIEEVDNGLHPSRARMLISMLKTLGQKRSIDILVTTHNPALLDAAGVAMVPFITVAHRDDATGFSRLTQLEDIEQLPKLMASGSLGRLSTEGSIESALKHEGG